MYGNLNHRIALLLLRTVVCKSHASCRLNTWSARERRCRQNHASFTPAASIGRSRPHRRSITSDSCQVTDDAETCRHSNCNTSSCRWATCNNTRWQSTVWVVTSWHFATGNSNQGCIHMSLLHLLSGLQSNCCQDSYPLSRDDDVCISTYTKQCSVIVTIFGHIPHSCLCFL